MSVVTTVLEYATKGERTAYFRDFELAITEFGDVMIGVSDATTTVFFTFKPEQVSQLIDSLTELVCDRMPRNRELLTLGGQTKQTRLIEVE